MNRAHLHALNIVPPDSSLTVTIVPHVPQELPAQWMRRHAHNVQLTHFQPLGLPRALIASLEPHQIL